MQLYTINATPVMSERQASEFPAYDGDIVKFNKGNLKDYKEQVAGILANQGIDGFTIYQVDGYYKGESEVSFKIEVATDASYFTMGDICNELRDVYHQESVMLTLPNNKVEFI